MTSLTVGDPVPWFTISSTSSPNYHFDTVGGYRSILFFLGSSKTSSSYQAFQQFNALQEQFEKLQVPCFVVTIDPDDISLQELIRRPGYFKLFWDFDRAVSHQYGVCWLNKAETEMALQYTPTAFVIGENLRIQQIFLLDASAPEPTQYVETILNFIKQMPPVEAIGSAARQAPVLFIPNVFEPAFCQSLIDLYEADGGRDSGFMRQIEGKTVEVFDHDFKKRRDFLIQDSDLLKQVNDLILCRVKPEIEKAFQFSITRFERHLVACYDAETQGFFNRHRDNTTKGTAHRRFAMSLNLNAGAYEGGCLRFPEYGSQLYCPETGEALIFSCSLLHEATPVTRGRRFALLSFFYNDDDAKVREQNQKYVELKHTASSGRIEGDRPSLPVQTKHAPVTAKSTNLGFQSLQPKKKRR